MNRPQCPTLPHGATRRLLQPGRCFAALVNCRFMHHGRRFHCAAPVTACVFLSGLPQAKHACRHGAASSEQLPSREPCGLFDEKRVAPLFAVPGTLARRACLPGVAA